MTATLSTADWIAIGSAILLLAGKLLTDVAGYATARHDSALARIVGMVGREAATIARALGSVNVPANGTALEASLIGTSVNAIMTEMGASVAITSGTTEKITAMVQSEVDRLITGARVAVVTPASASVPARAIPVSGIEFPSGTASAP